MTGIITAKRAFNSKTSKYYCIREVYIPNLVKDILTQGHHYHHHISIMELGQSLTRSGLTYPEVPSNSAMIPSASWRIGFPYNLSRLTLACYVY